MSAIAMLYWFGGSWWLVMVGDDVWLAVVEWRIVVGEILGLRSNEASPKADRLQDNTENQSRIR
jgi:hypothetical protein